jgi:hypothetical protein
MSSIRIHRGVYLASFQTGKTCIQISCQSGIPKRLFLVNGTPLQYGETESFLTPLNASINRIDRHRAVFTSDRFLLFIRFTLIDEGDKTGESCYINFGSQYKPGSLCSTPTIKWWAPAFRLKRLLS